MFNGLVVYDFVFVFSSSQVESDILSGFELYCTAMQCITVRVVLNQRSRITSNIVSTTGEDIAV